MSGLREAISTPEGREEGSFGPVSGEEAAACAELLRGALWVEGTQLLSTLDEDGEEKHGHGHGSPLPIRMASTEHQSSASPLARRPSIAAPAASRRVASQTPGPNILHLRLTVPPGPSPPRSLRARPCSRRSGMDAPHSCLHHTASAPPEEQFLEPELGVSTRACSAALGVSASTVGMGQGLTRKAAGVMPRSPQIPRSQSTPSIRISRHRSAWLTE